MVDRSELLSSPLQIYSVIIVIGFGFQYNARIFFEFFVGWFFAVISREGLERFTSFTCVLKGIVALLSTGESIGVRLFNPSSVRIPLILCRGV
jgi:hypothetical protein